MAAKFWVGGTGNLDGSDTTHISDTTGGAGGATYPAAGDDFSFDALSGGGTVTFTAPLTVAILRTGEFTGTIDTNGQTVTTSSTWYNNSSSGTRTINLGASAISAGIWQWVGVTGVTLNAGTSTITHTSGTFSGGGLTYATAVLTGNNTMTGANTFGTLTKTGSGLLVLAANQIVTGTFTVNGLTITSRALVSSSVKGTARTITAATVVVTNADFQDITGAGAGSWDLSAITGGSGDCGGNSVITFSTPQTNYAIGTGARSASTASMWSTSTGGAADGRVPLPQDSAVVDANSGTGTITQNMPRTGGWSFVGSSGITWTTSTTASFFGSIDLTDLATLTASTQTYTYEGRGASTLTSAGQTINKNLTIDCVTGSLTQSDAMVIGFTLTLTSGGFSSAGFSTTMQSFTGTGTATRSLTMGASTWTLSNGGATWWNMSTVTGLTFDAGTSTIRYVGVMTAARSFIGGGLTYYRLENASSGAFALQITGSNTFSNGIYIDASAAARTVQFAAGTTTTVGSFTRDPGSNIITIGSVTAASHTLAKTGGLLAIGINDVSVSYSTATPGTTWYATGVGSVDGGNNSGWTFGNPVITTDATAAFSTWVAPPALARTRYTVGAQPAFSTWVAPGAGAALVRLTIPIPVSLVTSLDIPVGEETPDAIPVSLTTSIDIPVSLP